LAWHIDHNEVFFGQGIYGFCDKVEVLEEEFEAVDEAAVGAESHFFHDIGEGDKIFDIEVRLMGEVFSGRVEVDIEAWSSVVL
jgi:hypothetical protein